MQSKLLVALATYNESLNIASLIQEIHKFAPEADILVVDDNSPDGTSQVVQKLADADGRIALITRPGKLGLGTATVDAINFAIRGGYDFILTMDADWSHPPSCLPKLIECSKDVDVAIGSRYVKGGRIENWPLVRRIVSKTLNKAITFAFGLPVRDASGAYRCYRISFIQKCDLSRIQSKGYSFFQEILLLLSEYGATFCEIPIVFTDRIQGSSKVNRHEVFRSLFTLTKLGTAYRVQRWKRLLFRT